MPPRCKHGLAIRWGGSHSGTVLGAPPCSGEPAQGLAPAPPASVRAGPHHGRALLLVLLHQSLRVVALPEAIREDLHARVMDLLPSVEATALAHGADAARAHVVHVVEKHLVPAVTAAEEERHGGVDERPGSLRIRGEER